MSENDSINIPDGALLSIANNILDLLEYSTQLDKEDELYSDDFYIAIVQNLVADSEKKLEIEPGKTKDEKVRSLEKLLNFLSETIGMDLSHIYPHEIIYEHEKMSTKYLLELIEELIKALIEKQNQEEGETNSGQEHQIQDELGETESGEEKNSDLNDFEKEDEKIPSKKAPLGSDPKRKEKYDDIERISNTSEPLKESTEKKLNASDGNINRNKNNISDEMEINDLEDDSPKKEKAKPKKDYDVDGDEEEEDLKESNKQKEEDDQDIKIEDIPDKNKSEDDVMPNLEESSFNKNQQSDSKDIKPNKLQESSKSKSNRKEGDENEEEEDSELNLKNKSCLEYLDLEQYLAQDDNKSEDSYLRKTFTDNSINRFERQLAAENEFEDDMKNSKSSKVTNVSRISEVSKSKENSEQQNKIANSKKKLAGEKQKINNRPNNNIDNDNDSNLEGYGNNGEFNSRSFQNNQRDGMKINLTDESNNQEPNQSSSKKALNYKDKDKNASSKNLDVDNQANPDENDNMEFQQSDISKSSRRSDAKKKDQPKGQSADNSSIIEENPLSNEEISHEIMKEIKKIYGDKLDRIVLKENAKQSKNLIELILRNIKLAKQSNMKIANRLPEDTDDLVTKEFMQRYQREYQYLIKHYKEEQHKRNFFKERAFKTISQNAKVMKKVFDIQTNNIEKEIERKRKCREQKKQQNQMRICNEIYAKACQMEKERYLEEIQMQKEINAIKLKEKQRDFEMIEKYYTDRIEILKEILRREKKEREIEHRAKIQYMSNLQREKKAMYKQKIAEIYDRFDEEDRKADYENNSQEDIDRLLLNHYKK